jgi:hypothetical protein
MNGIWASRGRKLSTLKKKATSSWLRSLWPILINIPPRAGPKILVILEEVL